MIKIVTRCFAGLMILNSCKTDVKQKKPEEEVTKISVSIDSLNDVPEKKLEVVKKQLKTFDTISDASFIRLRDFNENFAYDIRYATKNNFLKAQVYECAECYMRAETAKKIIKANSEFLKKGVRIKFFDCYRPNSVQHKMWKLVPNPQYVANPVKGSVHNRGGAVDITLETLEGDELDMGTDFDFFGWKGYHDNFSLPKKILKNRKLLKETMEDNGFKSIRSEWWHYNMIGAYKYKVADFTWNCN